MVYILNMETQVVITAAVIKALQKAPRNILISLRAWALSVQSTGLEATRQNSGLHDEPLKGQRKGQRSIRLNRQWRAIYTVTQEGIITVTVIEVTAHDYRTR